MGLPLFIAPVESDLPSKAAEKSSATSPPRSAIRRNLRNERRAAYRRISSIRERLNDGSLQQSGTLTGRDGRSVPWSEAGFPPDLETTRGPDGLRRARPFRDVLREMTRSDNQRRDVIEERINQLFRDGSNSNDRNASVYDEFGWWGAEAPPRPSRPAMAVPVPPRQAPEENEVQSQRLPSIMLQPAMRRPIGASEAEEAAHRHAHRMAMRDAILASQQRHPRFVPVERSRVVDGLGDRERSLSPEVWDTLLSTLTPDPQPPSAGSSFASNVASQSAGATSSTSFTTPDQDNDAMVDQACESGCEGSETEGIDQTVGVSIMDRIRRRRAEMRRVRVRVPESGLDGPVDGGAPRDNGAVGPDARQRRSPDGPLINDDRNRELEQLSRERSLRSRLAWVGHLSVGNSDDEQGQERNRQNRESSTASGSNTNVEDDWIGMQRIVRSLARREDIPDEWWAEAGLSRTLPGDGTE
ncbi:hypothetical protein FBEOM_10260 [Fusarium beomiforme]|uniref:Uncharacterized protein n=1 Tax=Fusarium beomiforme TaxID=44412 RepID=A0A9P5ABV2_9HYPO|nr:hypothetical protein FBEOM_10260 [Fusarium beomiforme]